MSVSILKEKKESVDPELRDWAVDLLADHSPTRFSPAVLTALKSGKIFLPSASGNQATPLVAMSADMKYLALALANGHSYQVVDLQSKARLYEVEHDAAITALDFSPEGKFVAVGFGEGAVLISEILPQQKLVLDLRTTEPVASIRFVSGTVFVLSSNATVRAFEFPSGRLVKEIPTRPQAPSGLTVKMD